MNFLRTASVATAALLAATCATASQALVIDFNAHAPDFGTPITDSGYSFSVAASGWGVFNGTDGACCDINDNGTRSLFADGSASITMTQIGGGTFGVSGFDASVYFKSAGATTLIVEGTFFGGGTISTTLNTNTTWQSFGLSGFQNLVSLKFTDGTPGGFLSAPGLGIDNIAFGSGAVPEPASWAMMIGGFALAGAAMRRRKAAVSFA